MGVEVGYHRYGRYAVIACAVFALQANAVLGQESTPEPTPTPTPVKTVEEVLFDHQYRVEAGIWFIAGLLTASVFFRRIDP